MSHIYECAAQKVTGAAAGFVGAVVTVAPRAEIREIGVFATTAVAGEVGLGRPAVAGAGTPTQQLFQPLDTADGASATNLVTAWVTTQPTAPTIPFRRVQLPAVVGAGVVWVWGQGEMIVPASSQIVIWQFSAAAVTYDFYVKILE